MHLLFIFLAGLTLVQMDVFAELSSSSCALLRTANSLSVIVPEIAQFAMRYYRASSSTPIQHHREKRFLFGESESKDGNRKGTVVEQTIANTIRDVNFTSVAILIFNNNETMNKIRQNVDDDAVIRLILREINYEKLGIGLLAAMENEFNFEHTIASIINSTRIDRIHDELLINGTLPDWLLKTIHPNFNSRTIERMFSTLKNVTSRFVRVLSKSERFDNYLFNMITQQALTPLDNIVQGVKEEEPKTFDDLIEIIVNNVNKAAMAQFTTSTKPKPTKKTGKKTPKSTDATVDLSNSDDVRSMLYQWSIAVDSMGQTARIMLKSLEQLYCTSA